MGFEPILLWDRIPQMRIAGRCPCGVTREVRRGPPRKKHKPCWRMLHRQPKTAAGHRRHGEGNSANGAAASKCASRAFARAAITVLALLSAWQLTTEKPSLNDPWSTRRQQSSHQLSVGDGVLSVGHGVQQLMSVDESEEEEGLDGLEDSSTAKPS